jgi:hypothetical protein
MLSEPFRDWWLRVDARDLSIGTSLTSDRLSRLDGRDMLPRYVHLESGAAI